MLLRHGFRAPIFSPTCVYFPTSMEEHAKVAGLGRFHLIANEEDAISLQSESLLTKR